MRSESFKDCRGSGFRCSLSLLTTGPVFFTRCVNTLVLSFSLAASIHWFCLFHSPRQYTGSVFFTRRVNTLVLSFSLAASIHLSTQSYCESTNSTTATMLRLLLLYQFWLAEICICHKPRPTRDETSDLQIALPNTLMLPFFFSILPAFHPQSTFALVLNFGVGHFITSYLSLFSYWCCYERNSIHTISLSHFISLVRPAHSLFFFIQPETVARIT